MNNEEWQRRMLQSVDALRRVFVADESRAELTRLKEQLAEEQSTACEVCPKEGCEPATHHLCEKHAEALTWTRVRGHGDQSCACVWTQARPTIGEAVPFLRPCAGHEVYGTWRAAEATKALEACRHELGLVEDELRATRSPSPVPLILNCPVCHARHIDRGDFATRVHHTHSCQICGVTWRPAVVATVGVEFLPGFRDQT